MQVLALGTLSLVFVALVIASLAELDRVLGDSEKPVRLDSAHEHRLDAHEHRLDGEHPIGPDRAGHSRSGGGRA